MRSPEDIKHSIDGLTAGQAYLLDSVVSAFSREFVKISRKPDSDIISDDVLLNFGDFLRVHHCFSKLPFTKDKFEYALEEVLRISGVKAELAPTGNPGYDISIEGVPVSLKSQADKSIKPDYLHISKFMELGKGEWGDQESHLVGLREQFFQHMGSYSRILSLRCLSKANNVYHYELVEVPISLLQSADKGVLRMMHGSTQMPKPGYCDVLDEAGKLKFQLYFDGGGERKLQIKAINKHLCIVHAEWIFEVKPL